MNNWHLCHCHWWINLYFCSGLAVLLRKCFLTYYYYYWCCLCCLSLSLIFGWVHWLRLFYPWIPGRNTYITHGITNTEHTRDTFSITGESPIPHSHRWDHNKDHPFIDSWVMGLEENISVVVKYGGAYHQLKDIDTRRRVVNWGLWWSMKERLQWWLIYPRWLRTLFSMLLKGYFLF